MMAVRLIKLAELADWYALGWRPVSFSGDWIEIERRFPGQQPVSRRRRGWYRPREAAPVYQETEVMPHTVQRRGNSVHADPGLDNAMPPSYEVGAP